MQEPKWRMWLPLFLMDFGSSLFRIQLTGILVLGAIFIVAMPPMTVPDEHKHVVSALSRKNKISLFGKTPACTKLQGFSEYFHVSTIGFNYTYKLPTGLYETASLEKTAPTCEGDLIPYGNLLSYPGILGASILSPDWVKSGRNSLEYYYEGKVLSGLLTVLALFLFVQSSTGGVPVVGTATAFVLAPLFIQQTFSNSADVIVLIFPFLLAWLVNRADRLISNVWLWSPFFILISTTVLITKPVNAPVFATLLVATWISKRGWVLPTLYQAQKDAWVRGFLWICLLSSICLVFVTFYFVLNLGPGVRKDAVYYARPEEQWALLKTAPLILFKQISQSIHNCFSKFEFVTGSLGWLDLPLPIKTRQYYYWLFGFGVVLDLLGILVMHARYRWADLWAVVIHATGALLSMCAMLFFFFLLSPPGLDFIVAVQPRYFLPPLLMFFVFLGIQASNKSDLIIPADGREQTMSARLNQLRWVVLAGYLAILIHYEIALSIDLMARYH